MVREQLDRILANSLFRNSRRFPDFLRYTVDRALADARQHLKERTIGIEVFHRDPNYDTNLDPIVRVTATQVRRRLRHYYNEMGHEHELRIEFIRGSYIPEIQFPGDEPSQPAAVSMATTPPRAKNKGRWLLVALVAAPYFAALVAAPLRTLRHNTLDRFLDPVANSKAPVLLCISAERPAAPTNPAAQPETQNSPLPPVVQAPNIRTGDQVSFGDSMALSTLTGVFGRQGIEYHVRHTQDASLNDLKAGPVVLIGGFNNHWTMRLDSGLRFSFAHDGELHYIADRQNPTSRDWSISNSSDTDGSFADYALISRVLDTTTGRVLITVAGIRRFGTESAAECLADSACLESAEGLAPGDWKRANVQVVLKTTVIGNEAGKPHVLAAYLW